MCEFQNKRLQLVVNQISTGLWAGALSVAPGVPLSPAAAPAGRIVSEDREKFGKLHV
jgi:hypothetical protein